MQRNVKTYAILASALLAVTPVASFGQDATASDAYEESITAAKTQMMGNSAAALKAARDAEKQAGDEGRESALARLTAKWLQGEALMRLNRAPEAQKIISEALEEVARIAPDDKLHADLLRSQAGFQAANSDYGEALSSFQKAHDRYKALGEGRSQAIVLQNMGSLYSDARDYERVLSYYREATTVYPEDASLSLSAHNNRGNALKELGRYDEAEEEFQQALGLAGTMSSAMLEARILTNIASTQFLNGQVSAAEQSVNQGMRLAERDAADWMPFLHGVKSQIAYEDGRTSLAQVHMARAFEGQDLEKTSPYFRDFHETAYRIYSETGDYRLAAQHIAAFNRIDSQARDLSAQANNALLGARFDAENRELRISKLSAEKELNEAQLMTAQNQNVMLSAIVALVILAFLIALAVLRTVNRNREAIKTANEKLTYVTQHDSLTGLYARDHFRHLLDEETAACARDGNQGVLMLIDLDRFKQVNDVFGHAIGDALLAEVAQRFRQSATERAVIGRLGGDEFGLFLPHPSTLDEAAAIATAIIERVGQTFVTDDKEVSVGASIGMAEIGRDGSSTSILMTNADLALYEAKGRGRGMHVSYRQAMRGQLEERALLERDLKNALKLGEISVSFQPIVANDGKTVVCQEALMRWNHPERGAVSPEVFIPIAEDALLIGPLGEWLLRTACHEAVNWSDDVKLTVNVSALQLNNRSFLGTVVEALAASGLAPERLVLEITESIVLEMDEELEGLIRSLTDIGVSFALDDFGRGYSSLNYIEKMQFSMIKIDRDFVQAASSGSLKSQAIVTAIVSLAQSLDMVVTAEGIEADEQAIAMRALGCTCFQGYFYGAPTESVARTVDGAAEIEDRKVA
ncbi:EAL domain-containing protein [Erythrobacter crassostreae]|uniref:EAL domain-containing protein n=1 Tax=Erythrobacter crassostreae TaxID=2828328 RepID=A0A9X1F4W2_9SPHN|nr:EAL domain-containing protein [Erythrobacter crassostrea]MBV7260016.1 EAL domain-containing protein [Erythrobacter crassostrea]